MEPLSHVLGPLHTLGPLLAVETIPGVPDQLTGPVAALALTILAIVLFVREVITPGSRALRAEAARDEAIKLAENATASMKAMAAALEERNRLDQERLKLVQIGLIDEYGQVRKRPGRRGTAANP